MDSWLPPWLTMDAVSVPIVGWAARRDHRSGDDDRRISLMGLMGAFVFAAQMINVPIGAGVSGHLLGGTLLALILGPASASLVLTAVLILQALLFQDGGLLALGANVFNMALAGVAVGYTPTYLLGQTTTAAFIGGVLSVIASGTLAFIELGASGVTLSGWLTGVALGLFLITGLFEGAITVAVVRGLKRLNPAFVRPSLAVSAKARMAIMTATLVLAISGAWIASAAPDVLQKLGGDLSLTPDAWVSAPMADYRMNIVGIDWAKRPAAALAGIASLYVLFRIRRRREAKVGTGRDLS